MRVIQDALVASSITGYHETQHHGPRWMQSSPSVLNRIVACQSEIGGGLANDRRRVREVIPESDTHRLCHRPFVGRRAVKHLLVELSRKPDVDGLIMEFRWCSH